MLSILKQPVEYHIDFMRTCFRLGMRPGKLAFVIKLKDNTLIAVDQSDDYNLSRYLGDRGAVFMGRGVLIENVISDEWFVAWRPFAPAPECLPWKD